MVGLYAIIICFFNVGAIPCPFVYCYVIILITKEHFYADLGEIISGAKKGREVEDEITIFKSNGLAIQDAATAKLVYDKAIERGIGTEIDL